MNVHFLILNTVASTKAVESIEKAGYSAGDYTIIEVKESIQKALNNTVKTLKHTGVSHYCILPTNAEIVENYKELVSQYSAIPPQEDSFYLPLVELFTPNKETNKPEFRGILNRVIWHPYFATVPGELDHDLALKQTDFHLYGALIPAGKIADMYLREDIKYYWYFEYFNNVTLNDEIVKGLPKITTSITEDYQLSNVPDAEKIADFKRAKELYEVQSLETTISL